MISTLPLIDSASVTVIPVLSMPHFRATCYEFFSVKVTFSAGAYFDSVWSTLIIDRSSRPDVFYEKGVLRIFAKFTGKHLCQSLFLKKIAGLRLWHRHRCFPVNFAKFLRTYFLTEQLRWLLLKVKTSLLELWHTCYIFAYSSKRTFFLHTMLMTHFISLLS